MKVKTDFFLKASLLLVSGMIILLLFSSCNKYALYQTSASKEAAPASNAGAAEKILGAGDKISISIWGHDDLSVGSIHTVYNTPEESGKWLMIDEKGEVNLPQVGRIKLEGLSLRAAEDKLVQEYSRFIQRPVLNLRLLNNQVTVLGEVQRPGNYVFHTDGTRLVDMLGKAGGLTDYARTSGIKIIRGTETYVTDLTNASANETMVYARDVIYVPPGRNKAFDRFATKLIPLASLLTALALVYNVSVND